MACRRHLLLLLAYHARSTTGHGVMYDPQPRNAVGMQGTGAKLTPFGAALDLANNGCGGAANGDPGVGRPTIAYRTGQQITVRWELTIPHPVDNLDTGVRVAAHFRAGDSFDDNILAGGVEGSGDPGTLSADALEVTVTLPRGKSCDYCAIQWIWAARQDGGSYIGCADVAITDDGTLPDYDEIAMERGNVLPGVPAAATGPGSIDPNAVPDNGDVSPPPPPGSGQESGGGSGNAGVAIGVTIGVLGFVGLVGFCYWNHRKEQKKGASARTTQVAFPRAGAGAAPPPPPGAASGLPPGWSSAADPKSGVTYYINNKTGTSQWTPPEQGV